MRYFILFLPLVLFAENLQKLPQEILSKTNHTIDYIFIGQLVLFFIVIILGMFYRQKILKTLNKELTHLKEELQKEVEYKNILLKESHHRIKNNLQIILSIISINTNKEDIKNQINAIKLAHQQLTYCEDDDAIDLQNYLADLTQEIILNFNIKVAINGDKKVNIDTAINIGIIINELVSNSIKYAFENHPNPQISITIETFLEKTKISYFDNGDNLSNQEFKKGFGLSIIESIVKNKLKGDVTFTLNNQFSSCITF